MKYLGHSWLTRFAVLVFLMEWNIARSCSSRLERPSHGLVVKLRAVDLKLHGPSRQGFTHLLLIASLMLSAILRGSFELRWRSVGDYGEAIPEKSPQESQEL